MKKVSLLTLSVSLALAGCGGSDDSGTTATSTTLQALDGYLKNAVVFIDANNDGVWQAEDEGLLGLTDSTGQITVSSRPEGTLAAQIIIPDGDAQAQLIALDSEKYADIYTVDMDRPYQAMSSEIVLRAPTSSNIISPLTDAVTTLIDQGISEEDAISEIQGQIADGLNLEGTGKDIDLYADYIASSDTTSQQLHKIAQIMTDVKSTDEEVATTKVTTIVASAASQTADMTSDELEDTDYVPSITDSENLFSYSDNIKLVVDNDALSTAQSEINALSLSVGSSLSETIDLSALFNDRDYEGAAITLSDDSVEALSEAGITATIATGSNQLTLSADAITQAGTFNIKLTATDYNSEDSAIGTVSAVLTLTTTAASNSAPTLNDQYVSVLQQEAITWYLEQYEEVSYSLNISMLFNDADGDTLTYSVSADDPGILATIDATGQLSVTGAPQNAGIMVVTIEASDSVNTTSATASLELTVTEATGNDDDADTTLAFTNSMFTDGKTWRMGSFNNGDAEVGYAEFRTTDTTTQFCWNGDNTLTGTAWKTTLQQLDSTTTTISDDDCINVTVNSDGTLTAIDDDVSTFTMLYHATDGDSDQIIFRADGELFWLDSNATAFTDYQDISITDGDTLYMLADDDEETAITPMVTTETFTDNGNYDLGGGTYSASELNSDESEEGTWYISTNSNNYQYLFQNETADDGYERTSYKMRDFGDLSIYVTDKGNNDTGATFMMVSKDSSILQNIEAQWSVNN